MKKIALYAFSLAALSACSKNDDKPQTPEPDKQSLEVQVYNTLTWSPDKPVGSAATSATVKLFKTKAAFNSNTAAYTQTTDASGKASFASIDTGQYFIVATSTDGDNLLGAKQVDGAYVGYMADSLYQTTAEIASSPINTYAAPGNFRLEDLNMDGIVNSNDVTELPAQSIHIAAKSTNSKRILIGKVDNRPAGFRTKAELTASLQSSYVSLSKWHELQVTIDAVYTDDAVCGSMGSEWCGIDAYAGVTAANNTAFQFWKDGYQLLSQLNKVINYANAVSDMQAAEKELAIAQAKGVKAYVYFQLISYYGNVPMLDSASLPVNAGRPNTDVIYTYINDLLTAAASKLGSNTDIISAVACKAIQAKLALKAEDFVNAKTYSSAVITNTAYMLVDTTLIFTQTGNKELLWNTSNTLLTTAVQSVFKRGTFLPELRLTEMYLINAEANLHLGGVTDAVPSLNKVRQREKLSDLANTISPDNFRAELMTAWKRNMRTEGNRLPSLRRWDMDEQVLAPLGYQKYHELLPIPLNILAIYPNLYQNVGY
jgi:hypothetical protein